MTTLQIRKPYDRVRTSLDLTHNPKEVDDSFGNDTDVNRIIERFKRDGDIDALNVNKENAQYGDVTALQGDLTDIIAKGEAAKIAHEKHQQEQINQNKLQAEQNAKDLAEYRQKEQNALQNNDSQTEA